MGGTREAIIEAMLALAIVLAAVLARRDRLGRLLLLVLSAVWPAADQAWEGWTLLQVSHRHGVTVADLFGVAGAAWAAWLWFRPSAGAALHHEF